MRNAWPEPEHVQRVACDVAAGLHTLDEVTIAFAVEETAALNQRTAVIALYKRLLGA